MNIRKDAVCHLPLAGDVAELQTVAAGFVFVIYQFTGCADRLSERIGYDSTVTQ